MPKIFPLVVCICSLHFPLLYFPISSICSDDNENKMEHTHTHSHIYISAQALPAIYVECFFFIFCLLPLLLLGRFAAFYRLWCVCVCERYEGTEEEFSHCIRFKIWMHGCLNLKSYDYTCIMHKWIASLSQNHFCPAFSVRYVYIDVETRYLSQSESE